MEAAQIFTASTEGVTLINSALGRGIEKKGMPGVQRLYERGSCEYTAQGLIIT